MAANEKSRLEETDAAVRRYTRIRRIRGVLTCSNHRLRARLSERVFSDADAVLLIIGAVLFTPLVTLNSTLDPALAPQFVAWALVSSILCLSLLLQAAIGLGVTDYGILKRAIFPVFLGYLLFSTVSLTQAVNVTEGIYENFKIVMSVVFLLLVTIILLRKNGGIALVAKAVVITAILISLIGFCQFFKYGVVDRPGYSLLNGTMGHKNLFASGLFVLLPFCLYTVLLCRGFWAIMGIVATASIPPLILLSRTRAVWLALLVTLVVSAMVALTVFRRVNSAVAPEMRTRVLRRMAYVIVGSLLIVALVAALHVRSHSVKNFIATAANTDSFFERVSVWRKTTQMIRDHAVWGVGAGNWKIVFPSYGLLEGTPPDRLKTVFFIRPHNDFLWVWAEVGTIGFLFYVAIFTVTLLCALRIITQGPWSEDSLLAFLMFLGITGYIIICGFSFSRERVFDTIFLLLMMATVIAIYHRRFPVQQHTPRSVLVSILLVAQVLLLAATAIGYARLNGEIHTKRALTARMAQDWSGVLREIDAAYSAFASLDPMATPLKWYRGEADFASNNLQQAVADYEQALAAHPYHIHVLNNLATCRVLTNRQAEAIRLYEKAIHIFPRFDEAACNLAAVYFNKGDYRKAQRILLRCGPAVQNATLERYRRIVAEKLGGETPSEADGSARAKTAAHRTPVPSFADALEDVHRLWSSVYGRYLFTIDVAERDAFLRLRQQAWTDEGVAYRAFAESAIPGLVPVHRFHSPTLKGYFYTLSPSEVEKLTQDYPDQWRYQGIAFYAFAQLDQPHGTIPVHRLWSPSLQCHLYTADEMEVKQLKTMYNDTWVYEGVAWYTYP